MAHYKESALPARFLSGALTALFLLSLMGCAFLGLKSGAKVDYITLDIAADALANEERLAYVVIRRVNKMEFLIDQYETISDMAFARKPNESILAVKMILPGQKQQIKVIKPGKEDIGVYVLFTNPGENWKVILEGPLKKEYRINVKKNEVEEVQGNLLDLLSGIPAVNGLSIT
ncbi:MAG: hypothetical protein A4E70_01871 [Syntrophus sp. PtaU1.Bin005]|uniref:hypothetical protein n=1 Tax=Syntrophus TaxID=43773 RepID=UPI0009C65039|nr:MAG: hypothetical protein A4E69_01958 [Syntrophus sp. PtaB.Bin138]OPY80180.1 MAG: hypothetical protein A4E70_01871 [Syntrophus sp. PtaU1.Bin005]